MTMLHIKGWPLAIPTGRDTLLDSAVAAGVPFDHQCRAGECGRCKCLLLSGDVKQLPAQPGVLDKTQCARGWVLACRCVPKSDVTVELPYKLAAPRPKRQKLTGEVLSCHAVSSDVTRVIVESDRPLIFHAGQYVSLEFAGQPARSYSPANAPGAPRLSFLVRTVPGGAVSTHVATTLKPGDQCNIEGPYGTACLSDTPDAPLLLAGGGTGLAPMLSIVGELSMRAPETSCHLYIGLRGPQDQIAKAELARLVEVMPGLRVMPVYSDEAPEGADQGLVAPIIARRHPDLALHDVFIAGPPPMVESVEQEVIRLGATPDRVRSDPFVMQIPKPSQRRLFGLGRLRSAIGV